MNERGKVIFTLKKLKNCLPSLKASVEKSFKNGVVHKVECPRGSACYIGQTSRHLSTRIKEHQRAGPVKEHMKNSCNRELSLDDVIILCSSSRSMNHLMTLEALMINAFKPNLNTKDEYRSRSLVIKI